MSFGALHIFKANELQGIRAARFCIKDMASWWRAGLITGDAPGERPSSVLSELMAVNTSPLLPIREVGNLLRRINGLTAANLWQLVSITIHLILS